MAETVQVKKRARGVSATVVKGEPKKASTASTALVDPWSVTAIDTATGIIEPPYNFVGLMSLKDNSSELKSNIDAMATNVAGFGWRLARLDHTKPKTGEEPDPTFEMQVREEKERLTNLLRYIDYDGRSLTRLRRVWQDEMETTGNVFLEVIRDRAKRATNWQKLPTFTMRLTVQDAEPQLVKEVQQIHRGNRSKLRIVNRYKRFRRFVQASVNVIGFVSQGASHSQTEPQLVWFKEYGDPRTMDSRTGAFVEPGSIASEFEANEILHSKLEHPSTPYGVVRWIGALIPLLGVRTSEEINYSTFTNNNIPSLALMVSGGSLSEGSIARVKEFVASHVQGSDNYSKVLILEAESYEDDMGDPANVRMDIKPLTREQHTDALFQNYDVRSTEKVRQSFRLPPIYVGRSEEYTRATAEVSRKIGDEQIFNPDRMDEDHEINRFLVQEFGVLYHEFRTNTPNVTNDQDLIKILNSSEKTGAMTPRIAHSIIEDVFGRDLPIPQNVGLDTPYSLQMAEAVKNMADPTEPGQQFTAIKRDYDQVLFHASAALDNGEDVESVADALLDYARTNDLDLNEIIRALQQQDY